MNKNIFWLSILIIYLLSATGCTKGTENENKHASISKTSNMVTLPTTLRWKLMTKALGVNPCAELPRNTIDKAKKLYNARKYNLAYKMIQPLLEKYPQSAEARVIAGGALLYSNPPDRIKASELYEQAILLYNNNGCHLTTKQLVLVVLGTSLARMQRKDFAGSLPWLKLGMKTWSNSATISYNLACSYCMTKDVEKCFQSFQQTLIICSNGKQPSFPTGPNNNPASYYVKLSQNDIDLTLLRADPRYKKAVSKYLK